MSTTGTATTGTTSSPGTADAAKGAATDVAHEATSAAVETKETVKAEVGSVMSDAADRAGAVLRSSQQELRTQAQSKAKDLSSTLDTTAQQLASMADGADDPSSAVAQLSRSAADQLRRQSRRLEEGGLEGIVDDAKRLARDRPGVFMLGTIAAGFAFGRLAKHANLKQAVTTAKEELTGGSGGSSDGQPQMGTSSVASGPSTMGAATSTGQAGAQAPGPDGGVAPATGDPVVPGTGPIGSGS